MAIPRPKILTAITVPTGGWTIKIYASVTTQYDTAVTATIAAGTYFMANDGQSDDFLYELQTKLNTAIAASAVSTDGQVVLWIDPTTHKVKIAFDGYHYQGATPQDVKVAWTENDGVDIGAVLGFDTSADDTSTASDNPTFTGDYHHAYGWYADEDGLLEDMLIELVDEADCVQSVSPASGHVKSLYMGSRFHNRLKLAFIPRAKMYSADVGYGSAPVNPYERNEPLQCWWKEAREGTRFRVYRDGYIDAEAAADPSRAADRGATTNGSSGTTVENTGRTWDTEPQRWKGAFIWFVELGINVTLPMGRYVSSNTATTLTVASAPPTGYDFNQVNYFIFDHQYETYVVDYSRMKRFAPIERRGIDRFDLEIPLLRYES